VVKKILPLTAVHNRELYKVFLWAYFILDSSAQPEAYLLEENKTL